MLELILKGRPRFYLWLCFLGAIIGLAFVVYLFQLNMGLTLTGLSRDVSWGLYIAQFTYFVGVAAGAVMLLLDEQDAPLTEAEQKLVQTVAGFLGRQMEN